MDLIKTVLNSWKFWLVLAVVIVGYWVYKAGLKMGQDTPPPEASYPPSTTPISEQQKQVFANWAKTDGEQLVQSAFSYFDAWYSKLYYGEMRTLVEKMRFLSDYQLVWMVNTYDKRYYKSGRFMQQWSAHSLNSVWVWETNNYDMLTIKLKKLGLK